MYAPGYQRPLVVSPSSLKEAKACMRRWADIYIQGNRDQEPKANLLLGSIAHAHLESWGLGGSLYNPTFPAKLLAERDKLIAHLSKLAGGTLDAQIAARNKVADLFRQAPPLALTAVKHLPDRGQVKLLPEAGFTLDVGRYHAFAGPPWAVSPYSSRDLVAVLSSGERKLYDYKTTSDFRYQLTAEELLVDIQLLLYALATLDETTQRVLGARWIYMRTRGTPDSRVTDVEVTRDEVVSRLAPWFELADRCVSHMAEANAGRTFDLADYPAADTTTPCTAYGRTCHLSSAVGGPCTGPSNPSPFGWAKNKLHLPTIKGENIDMTAPQAYVPANGAPPSPPAQPDVQANLANRLNEATASLGFRPTEVQAHMAAPQPTYKHPGDGNTYPIFGQPGSPAKYSNGVVVTDTQGYYVDVTGARVTDRLEMVIVPPAALPAPPPAPTAALVAPPTAPPVAETPASIIGEAMLKDSERVVTLELATRLIRESAIAQLLASLGYAVTITEGA